MTYSTQPKIYLHLNASDTTLIHRAGILGLWMTLKQLEERFPTPADRLGELSWELTPYSVSLDWRGQDYTVVDWLLQQAFQLDERGLISLTGLNPQSMALTNKIHIHQAINETLLQYNQNVTPINRQYRVGINSKKTVSCFLLNLLVKLSPPWQFYLLAKGNLSSMKSIELNVDNVQLNLNYKQLSSYIYQTFIEQLCHHTTHQWIDNYIPIVSWLYPGASVRHEVIRQYNQCKEPSKYAFALLFLPVACHFLILSKGINEQLKPKKKHPVKYLMVIPDPINLKETAQIRWRLNYTSYQDLYVSSLGEAALSYYAKEIPQKFSSQKCQVILYGKLMNTSKLRNPIDIQDFNITSKILQAHRVGSRYLQKNKLIQTKINFLVKINLIKGIIADNLLNNEPIWRNIWLTLKQKDSSGEIKQQLKLNQRGLLAMIHDNQDIIKAHNAFVDVIHEALKIIYAQIYHDNPDAASKKIERENESFKSKLLDCYKEETFRHLMAKFLSKAGNLSTLNENRKLVLPILTGKIDWKEARDITLIALSSYPTQARLNRENLIFFVFPLLVDIQLYQLAFIIL